jgi:hypothetical protein
VRCAAITKAGERCKGQATHGSYCWNHAPEFAEARRRRARKGGTRGGNGRSSGLSEVAEAKRWIRGLVGRLLNGEVGRDTATAAFMGLNTLGRFIELERKLRDQEELVERLEALEEALEHNRGGNQWEYRSG